VPGAQIGTWHGDRRLARRSPPGTQIGAWRADRRCRADTASLGCRL